MREERSFRSNHEKVSAEKQKPVISDGLRGQIGGTQSGHYRQTGTSTGTATGRAGTGGTVHSPQLIKYKAELVFFYIHSL